MGDKAPWTAEVFNAVPWILTGIFLFAVIYFPTRKFLLNSVGSRVTPRIGRQVAVGSLIAAVLISVVTWPVYENGFWDYGGLGAMDDVEDLDSLRAQPSDTLVHVDEGNVWADWEDECVYLTRKAQHWSHGVVCHQKKILLIGVSLPQRTGLIGEFSNLRNSR